MPEIPNQDRWRIGDNGDGTAQIFKADVHGVLDFSLCVNYETAEDKVRAELMRRAPEMLAALQDVMALWDEHGFGDDDSVSEPLYRRLKRLVRGV